MRPNPRRRWPVAMLSLGLTAAVGCHRNAPIRAAALVYERASSQRMQVQSIPPDPCAWISRSEAERVLGEPLESAPTRVFSVENPQPHAQGEACAYSLQNADLRARVIALQVKADDSGVLRTGFESIGNVESELKAGPMQIGAALGDRWDFHSAIPGGLTALGRGRIAIIVTSNPGLVDKGVALSAAIMEGIEDLPFGLKSDTGAVPPVGRDACLLIARSDAQLVLGPMRAAPYRSRKSTALADSSGASCTYFTSKHRALVVTPTWTHARALFAMMAGAGHLVSSATATATATATGETVQPKGPWDQVSIGPDGALVALKGDAMLAVQYLNANIEAPAAMTLLNFAYPALGRSP